MTTHLPDLLERYPVLQPCERELAAALDLLVTAYRNGNKLLICGNGGSAADSEHMVAELMKGFLRRRPIPAAHAAHLHASGGGEIAALLQAPLAAMSLASPVGLVTAIANDIGYEMVFAQQIYGLGRAGDVVLAISTSGKSRNVLNAVVVAKAFGLKTIVLTGRSGGELASLADLAIRVPADNVAEIQELHLPVYHWLSTELEAAFFAE